jgi:hypothetical protein
MLSRNCDLSEEAREPFAVLLALDKTQRTRQPLGWEVRCFLVLVPDSMR